MTSDVLTDLRDLLDEERKLLLAGELVSINERADIKAGLLAAIGERGDWAPEALAEVRAMSERNGPLFEAAIAGVKAAGLRLKDIRSASLKLDTYTSAGQVRNLIAPEKQVERRA